VSVPDRIRRAIRKRVRARDRYHRRHLGHPAKREARLIRRLRRRLLAFTAPRTQYDAVTLANIPKDARAVMAYVDGAFANYEQAKEMFPDALITGIAVRSDTIADFYDVEAGDLEIADCPDTYRRFKAKRPHDKPGFYMPASWMPEYETTMHAAGIKKRQYVLESAHWTDRHICGPKTCGEMKADSTQYSTSGETLDITKCRPSYWRR
jgi:hypothetical protein